MNGKIIEETDMFLIEFAEGRINFKCFQDEYNKNKNIRKVLSSKNTIGIVKGYFKTKPSYFDIMKKYNYNLVKYFKKIKWESKDGISTIHWAIWEYYLTAKGFKLKKFNKYVNVKWKEFDDETRKKYPLFDFNVKWADLTDAERENILKEMPIEIQSHSAKVKWFKQRLKEIYRSESGSYPTWLQDPEWPKDSEGSPLIFRKKKMERNSVLVQFFFFNEKTGEEVIVEQLD